MSDGADDTVVGDVTFFDTAYFDQEYKLKAISLGLLWWLMGVFPTVVFFAFRPRWVCTLGVCAWTLTEGEWQAWSTSKRGFGGAFGLLGLFWLLAYIKRDNRIFQKIYYRAIAWIIPVTWVLLLWVFIALMVGGTQTGGDIYVNLGYGFGMLIVYGGLEALAWYLASSGLVKFYRWDEQEWWNWNSEDSPSNWPSQLGEFVDY